MAGFEWTPAGPVPIGTGGQYAAGDEPSAPVIPRPEAAVPERIEPTYAVPVRPLVAMAATAPTSAPPQSPPSPTFDLGKPLTGRQLLTVAKARVKELDRMLRQVPAIQAERAELQRLIDAAKGPSKRKSASVVALRVNAT